MKNILFGTIFVLAIVSPILTFDCEWLESSDNLQCGIREAGDQLLFNDTRQATWAVGFQNRFSIDYSNTNITAWNVELTSVSKI